MPEYHDSRVTGPQSVPVFWRHSSHQVVQDLLNSGFSAAVILRSSDYSPYSEQRVVQAYR